MSDQIHNISFANNCNNLLDQLATKALRSIKDFNSFESEQNIVKYLKKICVSPPYFAFSNIIEQDQFLIAKIFPQQVMGHEKSVISVGEAGRHMAILGSCSCSKNYDQKNYYLFQNGDIINKMNNFANNYKNIYIVTAKISEHKRTCIAKGFVFDDNFNIIYDADMSYTVISMDLFKKFFGKYFHDNFATNINPYIKYLDNIEEVSCGLNFISYKLQKTQLDDCVGHFDNCPALPTAFLIYNIIHLCCDKVLKFINLESYIATKVKLDLKKLMFAVNEYKIDVKYNIKDQDQIDFIIEIKDDNEITSYCEFNIKVK